MNELVCCWGGGGGVGGVYGKSEKGEEPEWEGKRERAGETETGQLTKG